MTTNSTTAKDRLAKLGIHLPDAPTPFGAYVPAVQTGNLLFLSGMLATSGHTATAVGVVGKDLDVKAGREAAYTAALNVLALTITAVDSQCDGSSPANHSIFTNVQQPRRVLAEAVATYWRKSMSTRSFQASSPDSHLRSRHSEEHLRWIGEAAAVSCRSLMTHSGASRTNP